MSTRLVRISSDGRGAGVVEVDGHDISKAVRSVIIELEAGNRPRVELDVAAFFVDVFELEDPRILISGDVSAALVRLGWTPPADEAMQP